MSLQAYPLYDMLRERAQQRVDAGIDVKRVCLTISFMSENMKQPGVAEHYEEIAALMIHHELLTTNTLPLSGAPTGAQVLRGGKGLLVRCANMSPQLIAILTQYIEHYSQ